MHETPSHLLSQVPLSVSPFITLPTPPTLPHTYTRLPSTLPPSVLTSSPGNPPAYVTSPASGTSAHPSSIASQNATVLAALRAAGPAAREKVEQWERSIKDRELAEKRRRAPGWLDRDEKILSPATVGREVEVLKPVKAEEQRKERKEEGGGELGALMDRAFGGMGGQG